MAQRVLAARRLPVPPLVEARVLSPPPPPAPLRLRVVLEDAVFFVPRSSISRDVACVCVASAWYTLDTEPGAASWPVPDAFEQQPEDARRCFDPLRNAWTYRSGTTTTPSFEAPAGRGAGEAEGLSRTRAVYHLSDCEVFGCLSAPLPRERVAVQVSSEEHGVFDEVLDGGPVFLATCPHTGAVLDSRGRERWRRLSEQPFHLQAVYDDLCDAAGAVVRTRMLLADTDAASPLRLHLSCAEYCLLISIYYGAVHFCLP